MRYFLSLFSKKKRNQTVGLESHISRDSKMNIKYKSLFMGTNFSGYYEIYWKKRLETKKSYFISRFIPDFLKKYSNNRRISSHVPINSRVLDLGCGSGEIGIFLLQRGCKVIGLDISSDAVKNAKDKGMIAIKSDLNKNFLPINEESVDVVLLADVIEHLIDPLSLLKDVYRKLKKGGIVIIYVPNFARISNRIRMLVGDPIDVLHWDKYGDEIEHLHWFTKPKIENLVLKAGFRKIKFIPVGFPFGFLWGVLKLHGFGRSLLLRGIKDTTKEQRDEDITYK